jgi:hypothetical protein
MQMTILLFGILEIVIGFFGVILADFFSIFNLLTTLAGLAGLLSLFFILLHPSRIKIYDILGFSLVFGYGTGALYSLVSFELDGLDLLKNAMVEEYWLARTLGLVVAAAGFLHVLGRADSKGYLLENFSLNEATKIRSLWFAIITTTLLAIFIATGKIGFMGDVYITQGFVGISPSSSILLELSSPLGAVMFYIGMKDDRSKIKGLFIALAIVLLLLQFGFGRRIFVFLTLTYLMVFFFIKKPSHLSLKHLAFFVLIGITIQIATTSFAALRISTYLNKGANKSIYEMVPDAIKIYQNKDYYQLDQKIHENLRSRAFILDYSASIDKALSTIQPIYGDNLLRALVVATPSFIYPSKYKNKLFMLTEEVLINPHFRLTSTDNANTLLTGALADFGELGIFIIPPLFCFILSSLLSASRKHTNPLTSLLISLYILYKLSSAESEIGVYISIIRFMIIFTVILWFILDNKKTKSLIAPCNS